VRTSLAAATASALSFLSKRAASLAACSSVMSSLEAPVRWHEDVKSEKHLLGKEVVVIVVINMRTDIWVEARVVRGVVRVARSRDLVSHGGILYIRVAAERRIGSISLLDHDHNTYSLVLLALCTRRKNHFALVVSTKKEERSQKGKADTKGITNSDHTKKTRYKVEEGAERPDFASATYLVRQRCGLCEIWM
jgi:hypothetical protein